MGLAGRSILARTDIGHALMLYAVMLIVVISAGAGPYSLDALILGLIDKHVA